MLKLTFICAILVLSAGCVGHGIQVPIKVLCPVLPLPADPIRPIKTLNKQSKINDAAKAWVADDKACWSTNKAIRDQVDTYNSTVRMTNNDAAP